MDYKKLTVRELFFKLKVKINNRFILKNRGKESVEQYFKRYKSYRYALKHQHVEGNNINYLAAIPNPGAGIGHQMANWMAGYYYAKIFGLKFAHIPFSNEHYPLEPNQWEWFLGFGEGEEKLKNLKKQGYRVIRLPLFEGLDIEQVAKIRNIVTAYTNKKVVFLCGQDQFLRDLYLIEDDLKIKFHNASARKNDNLQFDSAHFNIAVHVRRTVIIDGKTIRESPEVRAMRWLNNDYYENVLKTVLDNIHTDRPITIWLFSTGKAEEFRNFAKYGEVRFCNDLDEYQSFTHLVYADLLITSKSSFSYKPALMNNGIKVCPRNFWHGYPDRKDWILCENDGTFDIDKLTMLFK